MKKRIIVGVVVTIMAFALAACSHSEENMDFGVNATEEINSQDEAVDVRNEENIDVIEDEIENNMGEIVDNTIGELVENVKLVNFDTSGVIEETVICNQSDVIITAKSLEYTSSRAQLKVEIENSGNVTMNVLAGTMGYSCNSVNGYMVSDGYLNITVGPGEVAEDTINFDFYDLQLLGIDKIADIELGIYLRDDDYNNEVICTPVDIKTSLADSYDYSKDTCSERIQSIEGQSKYEYEVLSFSENSAEYTSGVLQLSNGAIKNQNDEITVVMVIENNTDNKIKFDVANISMNGLSIDAGLWSRNLIGAGKRRLVYINTNSLIDDNVRKVLGISEPEVVSWDTIINDNNDNEIVKYEKSSFKISDSETGLADGTEVLSLSDAGVTLKYIGSIADDSDYSEDIHFVFLVENWGDKSIMLRESYDIETKINGTEVSMWGLDAFVGAGNKTIIDAYLSDYNFEDVNIESMDDIETLEFGLYARDDDYNDVGEGTVVLDFK